MYGFIVDEKGRKMFKLLGNVIVLSEVWNKNGVDILCLWVVLIDYIGEIIVLYNILNSVGEFYCCICNIVCFLLVNLNGFDFK